MIARLDMMSAMRFLELVCSAQVTCLRRLVIDDKAKSHNADIIVKFLPLLTCLFLSLSLPTHRSPTYFPTYLILNTALLLHQYLTLTQGLDLFDKPACHP